MSLPPNGKSIVLKGTSNANGRVTFKAKVGGQDQNLAFSNNLFSTSLVNKQGQCKSPLGYDPAFSGRDPSDRIKASIM